MKKEYSTPELLLIHIKPKLLEGSKIVTDESHPTTSAMSHEGFMSWEEEEQ